MKTHNCHSISVNVAVFNTCSFLTESINSILSQSFQDFELVIIDDGSTDGSLEILKDFATCDSRIKLFEQSNRGVAAARNLALKHSKGRYIAVMDSDDISLPDRLLLQKNYLDAHPNIDAVGSQWSMIDEDGKELGIDYHATDESTINALMYDHYALHHPTSMIRRCSMEAVGGYTEESGRLCVDYDLFMHMQMNGSLFANLPLVLFKWRLNPSGITHSKAHKQTQYAIQTRETGFAELLKANPTRAYTIAKQINYAYPFGSWFDDKVKQLLPEHNESLLYRTWKSLPTDNPEEMLLRAQVLWLRNPQLHFQTLYEQLLKQQMTWLAALVSANCGLEHQTTTPCLTFHDSDADCDQPLTSLFVPFMTNAADFKERLAQTISLCSQSDLPIEVIVFSAGTQALDHSCIAKFSPNANLIIINTICAWQAALEIAKGQYFVYLEEYARFNAERFLSTLYQFITNQNEILYMLDERYFLEAMDNEGNPCHDTSPAPKWSRSTLIGRDRLILSGFIHKPSLLNGFKGDLREYDGCAPRALARYLAISSVFVIHGGVLRYYLPGINLESKTLITFQQRLIDWYYDFGMTGLPAPLFWSELDSSAVSQYARQLSNAWKNNFLLIHPGNGNILKQFYLEKTNYPMRWPLFRKLLMLDKKPILRHLYQNKSVLDLLAGLFYCGAMVIRNRLMAWRG